MQVQKSSEDLFAVRLWLGLVLGMILLIVAVGGITRLTDSGLSMVTWEPILGALPPLNEAQWEFRFDQYKQFPEYQELRPDMTLHEFKFIFFWEYLHRLLGRLLGLVYALPLAWFWLRGKLPSRLKIPLLVGLLLGGAQGVMGWYMVSSGLVDNPYVSHYRLAAHLGLAFVVFAFLWRILLTTSLVTECMEPASCTARLWAVGLTGLLVAQIFWGALVAGLNAGFLYNTFPKMQGHWLPPHGAILTPFWINLLDNPATVQFIHRVLGTLLVLGTAVAWMVLRRDPTIEGAKRTALHIFVMLMIFQFWLGVFTLVWVVPLALGVMHQVTACVLLGASVNVLFTFKGSRHA
jgi:cytochrome c oxidase assembly protein subunit 15